jgi:RHS repeat-associated protein
MALLTAFVVGLGSLVAAPVVGQLASPNPLAPDAAAIQPPDGATTCNGTLTEHLQLQDASSANASYTDATGLTLHVTDNPNTTPCDTSYNDWWFLASTKDSTLTNSTYYGRAWYLGAGMPKNSAGLEHGWDLSDAGCPTSGKCGSSADGARTVYYSIMVCQNANGYAAGQVSGWHNGLTWNGTFYPGIDGWLRATAAGPCAYLANVQSDTIVLDQVDPTSSAASPTYSTTRSVPVTVTASDASSGLKAVQVSYASAASGPWTACGTAGVFADDATNGTITSPQTVTCTVPADGTWYVISVARDRAGNVEPAPASADDSTIVDSARPAAPSVANNAANLSGAYAASGTATTIWFRPAAAQTLTLTATGSDPAPSSGVSGNTFGALSAPTGWTYTSGFLAGNPGAKNLTWSASAGTASLAITTTDVAGSVSSPGTTISLTADSTTPTWSGFTAPTSDLVQNASSYTFTWAAATDAGAGLANYEYVRQSATFTDGTCGAFSDMGTSTTTTATTYAFTGMTLGHCYRMGVRPVDRVGNKAAAYTYSAAVKDGTTPAATAVAKPAFSGDRTFAWTYSDPGGAGQTKFQVQLSSDGGATWPAALDSGPVTGSAASWTSPASMALGDLTAYTWHVRVSNGMLWSAWTPSATFTYDAYQRGGEPFYARVPFDLGGGWTLDVATHSGEASLSRQLYSIPTIGPAGDLALSYNSTDLASAGIFGYGWSSNLAQHLWLNNASSPTLIIWIRADGGRVAFAGWGSTWTAVPGHFETLAYANSPTDEYTVTVTDQTRLVFESTGAYRLKRIADRFGKTLTLTYPTGSIVATDATGRTTTIALDASGRADMVTDLAGRVWDVTVSGSGDLTSLVEPDPDGAGPLAAPATTLGYSGHALSTMTRDRRTAAVGTDTLVWTIGYTSGKATSVVDPIAHAAYADVASIFTYNPGSTVAGLLKTYSPAVRNTWTYAFSSNGSAWTLTDTDPAGYATTRVFDSQSRLTSVSRPVGVGPVYQLTTYTYDRSNVASETTQLDASTSVTTASTYNTTNDLLTRSESDNVAATKLVTKYTYDASGHLAQVNVNCTSTGTTPPTPASSCTGAGTQDASTNLITTYTYSATDQVVDQTDPLGRVTHHTYDASGNETSVARNYLEGSPPGPDINVVTAATYELATTVGKLGLPATSTDPVGNVTTYAYDALGHRLTESLPGDESIPALTRTSTYDQLGNVLTETDAWTGTTRATTHVYDLANRETSLTDPADVATTTTYNAAGDASSSTSGGVTTSRTFDGLGRTLTDTVGTSTTTHVYDPAGNEIRIVDPAGVTIDRTFDRASRQLTELAGGGTTSYLHDALGRMTQMTDPAGSVTVTTYDRPGRTITTSVDGAVTWNSYDRAGNILSMKAATGEVAASIVDALDRVIVSIANCTDTGTTRPAGGVVCTGNGTSNASTNVATVTWFDAAGNIVASVDPTGSITRNVPNVRNLMASSIAECTNLGQTRPDAPTCNGTGTANGATNVSTSYLYDGSGASLSSVTDVHAGPDLTSETAYDAAGRAVAARDGRGTITRTVYEADGRVVSRVVNCTNTGTTVPTTDWQGCAGSGTQDGTYNLTTSYTYDSRGNTATETAPNGRVTKFVYDAADRLVERTENFTTGAPASDQNLTTYFAYDDAGRQAAVRAPSADRSTFTVTRYLYDDAGRLVTEIHNCTSSGTTPPGDPAWKTCSGAGTADWQTNLVTSYTYDLRGNRLSVTAPSPAATGSATTTVITDFAYDASDRLCRVLEAATSTSTLQNLADPCQTAVSGTTTSNVSTRYTYDGAGNLASMIDGRGDVTSYAYDEAGRMTGLTDPDSHTITWTYDALGRRVGQANRDSTSVTWTYDGAGRVLTRAATGIATVTYTHDANGNRLSAADGTSTITTTYDRLNRPVSVSASDDPGATTTYSYDLTTAGWTDPTGSYLATLDAFGREAALTDPVHDSTAWATTYRADGQPASLGAPNGNTTSYTYDASGRLTGSATTAGQTTRASYAYTLNRAGQHLSEASQISGDPTNGTVTFGYDPLGRLIGYSGAPITAQFYGWDRVPNRTSQQVGTDPTVTTTYDPANRPTTDSAGGIYSSDLDGRLTSMPGRQLMWDALGRLVQVKDSTGSLISAYSYDPLDRLASVTRGSSVTRLRYVGQTTTTAQARDGTGTILWNVVTNLDGKPRMDFGPGGSAHRFYGVNGHGDLTWTADHTGAVTATLRSDPWGVPGTGTGGSLPDFRFQGSWYDPTAGLTWAVSRWYAPTIGRFISEDTWRGDLQAPATRSLFAFAVGDPVNHSDATGMCAFGCTASNDGATRKLQWKAFFTRFPGVYYSCYRSYCWWVRYSGVGRGGGMLDFMQWEIDSRRLRLSPWWNSVNKTIVQSSLWAWSYFDRGIRPYPIGASPTYYWYQYIMGPTVSGNQYGSSWSKAWAAHQRSLWVGVTGASGYRSGETYNERIFIWKVLNNVEWYYRTGWDLDGALWFALRLGSYPTDYPATKLGACSANLRSTQYASYVRMYFPEPVGWLEYCGVC